MALSTFTLAPMARIFGVKILIAVVVVLLCCCCFYRVWIMLTTYVPSNPIYFYMKDTCKIVSER